MEQLLIDIGVKEGLFASLFIFLLFYVLKTSKEREEKSAVREDKLYNFLDGMKVEFAKLVSNYENLSKDVAEIKDELEKKGGNK